MTQSRKTPAVSAAKSARPRDAAPNAQARPRQRNASSALLGNAVYTTLKEEIRAGTLRSGDRLVEVEIAERLGVSRTPVREALQRLEAQRLIEFANPRGLVIATLSAERVAELYDMREVLEGTAARLAAGHATRFEVESMNLLVDRFKKATQASEAAHLNRRLDEVIAQAAHNQFLLAAMNQLYDAVALLGETTYLIPGRIAAGANENGAIVEAITHRDPDAAEAASRHHIRAVRKLRLSILMEKRIGTERD
jgi:DNA-binding GntR family transcriptional regulator